MAGAAASTIRRRGEERNAAEVQRDPVDELRTAVRRSAAQRFALDELDTGTTSQLDRLRRERDDLHARLGHGPPDPTLQVRPLAEQRRQQQGRREDALWRRNMAQQDLQRLGLIGRCTRPARRREIEASIEHLDAEVGGYNAKLAALERQLAALAPAIERRTAWERQHGPELQRLETLDQNIEPIRRLDQIATRSIDRGIARGIGLEL
jgi:hypothetical protein